MMFAEIIFIPVFLRAEHTRNHNSTSQKRSSMKIVTWNVNGIRAVHKKGIFEQYLRTESPDVLCIQETKASPEQLPPELLTPDGYYAAFHSCSIKKGYSGVAMFSKIQPQAIHTGFGIEKFDQEGRVVQMDFGEFILLNIYFPNGQVKGDEHRIDAAEAEKRRGRLQYKLDFYDALFQYCQQLRAQGRKIIICGDYNTAFTEDDLARPKENVNVTGFLPIEREKLAEVFAMGYVDMFREFTEGNGHYTWWSNQSFARERNVGWRIDYHCVSKDLVSRVQSCRIQPETMGSDHCPVILELNF